MNSKVINKIKKAIIESPYPVPESWAFTSLQNLMTFRNGYAFKSKDFNEDKNGLPVIRIRNVKENKSDLYYDGEYDSKYLIKPGDLLVTMDGDFIASIWTGNISLQNQRVGKVIVNDKYDKTFMYYIINPLLKEINKKTEFVTVKHLSSKVINSLPIPVPPLEEQKRIVNKLEESNRIINEINFKLNQAKKLIKKRHDALLRKAFNGELVPQKEEEEKAIDLIKKLEDSRNRERKKKIAIKTLCPNHYPHPIPESWEWVKISGIYDMQTGATPSRSREDFFHGTIPWIKTGEVKWNEIFDSEEHISEEAYLKSSVKKIPANSVLIAMYGQGVTRGRAGINKVEVTTNQAVCSLINNEHIDSKYTLYFFMEGYKRFRNLSVGGNQKNLSAKLISEFEFPLPPLAEQKRIVECLEKEFEDENKTLKLIEIAEQNLEKMRESLVWKAYRGELVEQRPEEGTGLELLKEIIIDIFS
ncbi:hypothetical protein CCZ20_27985 [Priestia aryabhattai]|uniref:restriction endonuclease subunit S n=1 Tax=Priestia aryabhattai TaxID=412384 RepID=UPI000B501AF8|nr:restriction endonuclease subunit S [Priestia aryabhattai]OVE34163.1 hypothetical protein CCZ20_27985 [Priestia aryabhattai]